MVRRGEFLEKEGRKKVGGDTPPDRAGVKGHSRGTKKPRTKLDVVSK